MMSANTYWFLFYVIFMRRSNVAPVYFSRAVDLVYRYSSIREVSFTQITERHLKTNRTCSC